MLHSRLSPVNLTFVETMRGGTLTNADTGAQVVANIGTEAVSRSCVRQLRLATPVKEDFVRNMCALFSVRDDKIMIAHRDVNSESNNYAPYRPSLFCSSGILTKLDDNAIVPDFDAFLRDGISFDDVHRIYVTVPPPGDAADGWSLIILDITSKKLCYMNPCYDVTQPISAAITMQMETVSLQIAPLIRRIGFNADEDDLPCILYPYQYDSYTQNDFDSGLYVIIAIYCMVYDCPLSFVDADMVKLRDTFAYWLLKASLPM